MMLKYPKVTLQITMLFEIIQIITMIGKRRLKSYLTMTMSTMMTLNKTMTLPIVPEDDQTEYVTLTQGTAMMILLHETCVNICRASNNMYPPPSPHSPAPLPLGHLQAAIGMEMMR